LLKDLVLGYEGDLRGVGIVGISLLDEVYLGLKSGHVQIDLPEFLLSLSLLGKQNWVGFLVYIRGFLGVDVFVDVDWNLFNSLSNHWDVNDNLNGNFDDLLDHNFDDFLNRNLDFLFDNLLDVNWLLDYVLLVNCPLDNLLHGNLDYLLHVLNVLCDFLVFDFPFDQNLDVSFGDSFDRSLDNPLNWNLDNFLYNVGHLDWDNSLVNNVLFNYLRNFPLDNSFSVNWSVHLILNFLNDFPLDVNRSLNHSFDLLLHYPFNNLGLFNVFPLDLLDVSLNDLLDIDRLVDLLLHELLNVFDLLDVSVLNLIHWNLDDSLDQIIHIFLSLNWSFDYLLNESLDPVLNESFDWNLDDLFDEVLLGLSNLLDDLLLVNIDFSRKNLVGIFVLIQVLLVDLINLINVNWILDDFLDSSLYDLFNWDLSDSIDVNWSFDCLLNGNLNHFLDWNFNYFFDLSFFVNLGHDVSLDELLNRSLNDDINWDLDLPVNRNWSLNDDLNLFIHISLIDDSLLSGAVDIHVMSGLLVTWSDLSVLKSGLSNVNILVVPDASVDLVRFSLPNFDHHSLALCNFDHFWLSLLLGNQLWVSLSDLRNPELLFGWVEVGGSVVRVAVIARDKSVLRLVVVWLVIRLAPLN
jgi:hypothetical protein